MSGSPDHRLNAYRDDLADANLEGKVAAARFIKPSAGHVCVPVCDVHRRPDVRSGLDTQLRLNQRVHVYDQRDGWSWIKALGDGYVGYVRTGSIAAGDVGNPTHRVNVPRTFIYPEPDLKIPASGSLSLGTALHVEATQSVRGVRYTKVADTGWVVGQHLAPADEQATDYVAVAESLINTPYLWGGTTAFGIDCSGLVQLSMTMCGKQVLRDSDMQYETVGRPIDPGEGVQRGDLVFWRGHVAIVRDDETIIHANAHSMNVALEGRAAAIERIAYLYEQPIGYRRPA